MSRKRRQRMPQERPHKEMLWFLMLRLQSGKIFRNCKKVHSKNQLQPLVQRLNKKEQPNLQLLKRKWRRKQQRKSLKSSIKPQELQQTTKSTSETKRTQRRRIVRSIEKVILRAY